MYSLLIYTTNPDYLGFEQKITDDVALSLKGMHCKCQRLSDTIMNPDIHVDSTNLTDLIAFFVKLGVEMQLVFFPI